MDINRVRRSDTVPLPAAPSAGAFGGSGDSFQGQLGSQLKENYRRHVNALLDDLSGLSDTLLGVIDLASFEKYRGLIRELLSGIVRNAYLLDTEKTLDADGRSRIYESVSVIDSKLDDLAKHILTQNSAELDYISRVDEIRGLILDLLL